MSGADYMDVLGRLALTGTPTACIACGHFIDAHPGTGRKPHTCGRMACKRMQHNMQVWRIRNRKSRKESAARFATPEAPQAPKSSDEAC